MSRNPTTTIRRSQSMKPRPTSKTPSARAPSERATRARSAKQPSRRKTPGVMALNSNRKRRLKSPLRQVTKSPRKRPARRKKKLRTSRSSFWKLPTETTSLSRSWISDPPLTGRKRTSLGCPYSKEPSSRMERRLTSFPAHPGKA